MSEEQIFSVSIQLLEGYAFKIDFGDFGEIMSDEPAPLGAGKGPNPMRLLAASIGNCLAASLLFAIRKFKGDPGEVSAQVSGNLERVDGRWRVKKMAVVLRIENDVDDLPKLDRVLEQFEDFCVVTQSVRQGIQVDVSVLDHSGTSIFQKN